MASSRIRPGSWCWELWIRGQGGLSATEIYWVLCFHGEKIKHAAGFDRREEALQAVRERCAA
jgi:hypothetical protein